MNLAIRKKLVDDGARRLELGSVRMGMAGLRNRELLTAAFVDTMEAKGDKEMFRAKCADVGVSPMVIMFLLSLAWDLLLLWWTHKDDA